MKTAFFTAALVALYASGASADCANACSGHGDCGTKDECSCYPNWQAADCSERTCPFGLSFVDTPQGDLNHDGSVIVQHHGVDAQWSNKKTWEKYPVDYNTPWVATTDEAHFYVECSNKGLCDRETGLCTCFDGYTGSSCQRTVCPNDCSGHGVCRTVSEIAIGAMNKKLLSRVAEANKYSGVETAFTYNLWDADKNQGCVCDPGYSGPDCSLRECPRGDDQITHQSADCHGATCADEIQLIKFELTAASTSKTKLSFEEWNGKTWTSDVLAVTAKAYSTTDAISTASDFANEVKAVLQNIPNGLFHDITVSAEDDNTGNCPDITGTAGYCVWITYNGNPGDVPLISAATAYEISSGAVTFTITEATKGNKEEVTCSNRGLCDYETGLCGCFKGYYGDDCSMRSTLAL